MLEWLLPLGGLYWLQRMNWINVDFPLRQAFRWQRAGLELPCEPKDGLFSPAAAASAADLIARYDLAGWQHAASRADFVTSLFYLEMLERALRESGTRLPASLRALDAGPSDWFYAPTLHALLSRFESDAPRALQLDGVELDAYRLYVDLHSRADRARTYIRDLPGARFLAGDVRRYREPVDLAFMLYPFIFSADHNRWGLPRRYLRPPELLRHVASLVKPGGRLIIANQGAAEREAQHRTLDEAGLAIVWWARHDSLLFTYEPERYVTVVAR